MPENPPSLVLPPAVTLVIAASVAVAALIAFAFMYGWSMYQTWCPAAATADAAIASNTSGNATTGEPDDPYVWVATGLAGLVAAVVAMAFSTRIPDTKQQPSPIRAMATGVYNSVVPGRKFDFQQWLATAYVITYLLVGVLAGITWVAWHPDVPGLISNLALTAVGLVIAIARSFFDLARE